MRNYRTGKKGFYFNGRETKRIIVTAFFTAVIIFCIFGIKANAAQRADNNQDIYVAAEKEYIAQIRAFMEQKGYYNSGITLTKTMEGDKICSYRLLLHHKDFDADNEIKVEDIKNELKNIGMGEENILVKIEIF